MKISIYLKNDEIDCFSFNNSNLVRFKNVFPDADIVNCRDKTEFMENLPDSEIVMIWFFKQEWLEKAKKLKWIATPAAGKDFFSIELPKGIIKTHGAFHGLIIAETVLGMMLGFTRGILKAFEMQRKSPWARMELSCFMNTLRGSSLMIIGFGAIGIHIAKLAKAFGMDIIGVNRNNMNSPDFFENKDKVISIDKLIDYLPSADHIVLAIPGDTDSDNIINRITLSIMKKTAFIYNIGRGNSINEEDLIDCLIKGNIGGAYLDVFKKEPLPDDSPLRKCPNLYIMPHACAISPQYMDYFIDDFAEKLNGEKDLLSF